MVTISPEQEIYNAIYDLCENLGYDVYEERPDDSATYPFVDLGEQFDQKNITNKDRLFGNTQVTVHVWHKSGKGGTWKEMISNIEREVWRLKSTPRFSLRINSVNKQYLDDKTTNSTLLHGIVEADIRYQ